MPFFKQEGIKRVGDIHMSALVHFGPTVRLGPDRVRVPAHGALTPCLGLI